MKAFAAESNVVFGGFKVFCGLLRHKSLPAWHFFISHPSVLLHADVVLWEKDANLASVPFNFFSSTT